MSRTVVANIVSSQCRVTAGWKSRRNPPLTTSWFSSLRRCRPVSFSSSSSSSSNDKSSTTNQSTNPFAPLTIRKYHHKTSSTSPATSTGTSSTSSSSASSSATSVTEDTTTSDVLLDSTCNKNNRNSNIVWKANDDTAAGTVDNDNTSITGKEFAKANYQKIESSSSNKRSVGVFPWRHSPLLLPRLDTTSDEFERVGYLLGGDVKSSNPTADSYATAFVFMKATLSDMIFFHAYKEDLAENMSWAFQQGVSSILSRVYSLPLQSIQMTDSTTDDDDNNVVPSIRFEHGLGSHEQQPDSSPSPSSNDTNTDQNDTVENSADDDDATSTTTTTTTTTYVDDDDLREMMDSKLIDLYQSAHEFGRESINVRLELSTATSSSSSLPDDDDELQQQQLSRPEIVNLFVFPFLSRTKLKESTGYQQRYKRMIDYVSNDDWTSAREIINDIMLDWTKRGYTESTVIAQVLIPCDEVFCVRDAVTGDVIQGEEDVTQPRRVVHLVRFEMTVRSYMKNEGFPVRNELGKWKITDIDDLLEGNLML